MKKKLVENNPPKAPRKKGKVVTIQYLEEEILILNFWEDRVLHSRHCFNTNTSEYATLQQDKWSKTNIADLFGCSDRYSYWGNSYIRDHASKAVYIDKADSEFVINKVGSDHAKDPFNAINDAEQQYRWNEGIKRYNSKVARINALMDQVPEVPEDIVTWAFKQAIDTHYVLKHPDIKKYFCTSCKEEVVLGNDVRNNDVMECPHCGQKVVVLKRKKNANQTVPIALVQPIDEEKAVVRYFRVYFWIKAGYGIEVELVEETRIFMYKITDTLKPKKEYSIFYNAWGDWQTTNPQSRRWYQCYMYDGGIKEAFKDTIYDRWTSLFELMSAAGFKCHYNGLMAWHEAGDVDLTELLYKGRFYRLLQEKSERVSYYDGRCYGGFLPLDAGQEIEEIFEIIDRQKINRIRDKNGGRKMLEWMQWSDAHEYKISDKLLEWLLKNGITPRDIPLPSNMSLEQLMNYIERQRKESYKGMSPRAVMDQYIDYMKMATKLQKDVSDAMIYKPRDLKYFHNMYSLEIEQREAEIKAEEYSEKYPEAESILGQIKDKFEYSGKDYFIKVPQRIVDIVTEGRFLHHCVANTDRYFDRIKCHETYICFLRKTECPEEPFYTIEVEPGGTIRQHRGYLDEEPDIDKIKPFLRKWQKEIKKRMKDKDHELAAASKILREKNIEELQAKGNTRVLDGLLEDFMEAI